MEGYVCERAERAGDAGLRHDGGGADGEPRFTGAVADLVAKGYPAYTIAQKHTVPAAFVNHSDDRLAFYAYLPLLNDEKDPALRGFYRRSLERSWEIERIEKNPWFNFIYGKLTGAIARSRLLLTTCGRGRWTCARTAGTSPSATTWRRRRATRPTRARAGPPPPRERGGMRWSDNGVELQAGGGGRTVRDRPAGWRPIGWAAAMG